MAKTTGEQTKFIELRAKGYSFDRIAGEIGTSKPTLIKWQKEFSEQISELKFAEFEGLAEQFALMRKHRVEYWGKLYAKAKAELDKRTFDEIDTKELLEIVSRFEGRLCSEFAGITHTISETEEYDFMDDIDVRTIVTEYEID